MNELTEILEELHERSNCQDCDLVVKEAEQTIEVYIHSLCQEVSRQVEATAKERYDAKLDEVIGENDPTRTFNELIRGVSDTPYLTGQEWYDRFVAEVNKLNDAAYYRANESVLFEAAKKATGLLCE